jgi:hypothetical protein
VKGVGGELEASADAVDARTVPALAAGTATAMRSAGASAVIMIFLAMAIPSLR